MGVGVYFIGILYGAPLGKHSVGFVHIAEHSDWYNVRRRLDTWKGDAHPVGSVHIADCVPINDLRVIIVNLVDTDQLSWAVGVCA